jgi:CheY-like chemotaxis protein
MDVIFERFEQLDHSFTRQQGGTGLGLAITKKLVEAMGGSITVKSEVNKGSEFELELEFERVVQKTTEKETMLANNTTENISLTNTRILVAEDNKMNQLLVKTILNKYQVETEMVENGEDVLTMMRQKNFDLVLMDVQMPKVDGISATLSLRNEISTVIPVIAMTAHVLPGEREKCIDAGMNDYLTKPLDEEEVITMLKRYLELQQKNNPVANAVVINDWLNMPYLNGICGNDEKRVLMILQELNRQLPAEIIALQRSVEENDTESLKKICHSLTSTLSPFLATASPVLQLYELNQSLMEKVSAGNIAGKTEQLVSELATARRMLKNYLEAFPGNG